MAIAETMAEHDIYIDCDRAAVVTSQSNSSIKTLPRFVQGDTMLLRIHLLKGFASVMEDYEVIPTSDLTLQVALGTRVGNSTTYYAQNLTSWAESEALDYFEGEFSMATAEVTAYLGTSTSKQAFFEIKYIRSGLPTTVLSQEVQVLAAVIKEGGFVAPTEPTPLSVEVGNAIYVIAAGHQGSIRLISPDGTKQCDMYYGDDGAMHFDAIT
jgi:hypothetical protein